jgi:hypothetical protein
MPDADSEGRYANLFHIGFNAFEFVIELGQRFAEDDADRIHTRIITNPWYARRLLETLGESLRDYERIHGVILDSAPPADGPPR